MEEPPSTAKAPEPHPHHGQLHHGHYDLQAAAAAIRTAKLEGAQRLQEFEAQRIAYFTPQLRSNGTHWCVRVDLMRSRQPTLDKIKLGRSHPFDNPQARICGNSPARARGERASA